MEQAITIRGDLEDRADDSEIDIDAEEMIDAFDHVLEALDQVILLAEFARSKGMEAVRR